MIVDAPAVGAVIVCATPYDAVAYLAIAVPLDQYTKPTLFPAENVE